MHRVSIGWVLAAIAWFSVFQQPLWAGALGGLVFGLARWQFLRKQQGCLGCLTSSAWAWPLSLLGGIVWLARAI